MAVGDDQGEIKVFDIRQPNEHVSYIKWHTKSINCIAWNQFDDYVLMAGSEDSWISIWDLSVESNKV